jgi:hypothetical protein
MPDKGCTLRAKLLRKTKKPAVRQDKPFISRCFLPFWPLRSWDGGWSPATIKWSESLQWVERIAPVGGANRSTPAAPARSVAHEPVVAKA